MKKLLLVLLSLPLFITYSTFGQNTLDLAGLSGSSAAKVAYSLRRLSSSYSGNLIQVRRSSDNTTSDIGFDGSGNLDQAALLTFVGTGGTDNGFIVKWYDQSGNANDAVQSTTGSQPQIVSAGVVLTAGSRATIKFDGSTFIDGGTTAYGITGQHTLSAVYNFQSGTVQHILDRALTGGGNPLTSITGSNQGQYRNDAGSLLTVGSTQTPPFSNTFTATWDASNNIKHYKNGVSDYSGSLTLPATLDIMRIGRHFSITGSATLNFWEVILFPTAITNSERMAMECNQQVYFGIATMPAAITGNTTLSTAITTTLADATAGGTWSSVSTAVGTIGSTSGVVTGLSAGTSVISYTMATGCAATATVSVKTPNNALSFDGVDDAVTMPNSAIVQIGTGTIEAWINTSGAGGSFSGILVKPIAYGLYLQANILGAYNWGTSTWISTGVNLADGLWHHVAMTFQDGVINGSKIYIDGTLSTTFTYNISSQAFSLGVGNAPGFGQNFAGKIDECRVWNTVLSQTTIQANMNCDVPQGGSLVAYYRFDQGTASGTNTGITSAADYSGNGNCGTLANFALTGGSSNYVTGAVGTCNSISGVAPGTFSGNTPVCVGSSITLSNSSAGGTWSTASGNITLNSTTGLVTGVAGGTATVTYSLGCSTAPVIVTVSPIPAAITGNTTLSTAITTTLADATVGGTWSSVSTAVGTIGSTSGVVTGLSAGTSVISYTMATGCAATATITVKTPTNGLHFDGTSDYVSVSGNTGIPSGNGQYTIEAWIKPTAGGVYGIAGWGNYGTNNQVTAFRLHNSTTLHHYWWFNDLSATVPNLVDGNWHHVACTYNGTTRAIYCDGALVASDVPSGHNVTVTNNVNIGRTNNTEYFPGGMDEVRIWNVGRTQAQIRADMNCDVAQQSGLVAYYRFDQGTASGTNTGLTCAYDYSGNANTGTLNTFALSGGSSNYITGAVGTCSTATPIAPGSFSGNSPVCVGSTITLSNANTGGTWSTASGNITINSTSGLVTGVTGGTASVNYTLNCSTSSVTVTINALPTVASITGTTTLTVYNTTTLSDATSTGVWSSTATGVATVNSTSGVVSGVSEGNATISYTVTNGAGCVTAVTTNVTVSGNNALSFDGTNDYVNIGTHTLNSYTKEAWIFLTNSGLNNNIISGGVTSTDNAFWAPAMRLSAGHNGSWTQVQDPATLSLNTWYHVAVTYDASTTTMNLYKNGVLVSSNSSVPVIATPTGVLLIGAYTAGGNLLQGKVDEVRIWNRALCQSEIANDMAGRLPGGQTGLLSNYTFDQGIAAGTNTSLTTLIDNSGNGHDGTLINYALTGGTSNWVTGTVNALAPSFTAPTITASANVTICPGATTTLTVSGGSSYTWSPATSLSATTGNSVTSNPSATITYTITDACGGTATVQVSVNLAPSITSVTPLVGYPASSVGISGTNFDATTTNNIVYFGATRATVTSATTTSLNVTVPTGATFERVTVETTGCGLTAFSKDQYLPSFNNAAYVANTVNVDAKVDFATGSMPEYVTISDLDGDGKPDLAVVNNAAASVTVYRNTSTSGTITSGSFATGVNFTTGSFPRSVTAGDVDGDGKPDLVVLNYIGSSVSVFRNTSTSGSITSGSFAAKVDFTTVSLPFSVVIGDIDGDGKPDLAVSNFTNNTLSVFRNTGTPGAINSGSFAAKVDFTTATGPTCIAMADLDGDGKADLVTGNITSDNISVLRNTSTAGSLSFAAKVDFTSGTDPTQVAIGDIDGDGKQDIVVANRGSATFSVIRNTSSSGSITSGSFAAKVDFTTGTNPACIALGDLDGDGKVDAAVPNEVANTISLFLNTSTSGTPSFATQVEFAAGTNPESLAVGDLDGDGLPDIVAPNINGVNMSIFRNDPLQPISGTTVVCVGSTTTLADATAGGTWSSSNPAIGSVGSASGVVTGVSAGTITITYSGTAGIGILGNYTTKSVTVNASPTVGAGANVSICVGASTGLTATGAAAYTWTPAASLSASTGASVTATPTVTTIYTVTGTNAVGCSATATQTVTVNPYSAVYAITGGGPYCSGGTGSVIGLSGSDVGFDYQLYKNGVASGVSVAGTGSAISFGPRTLISTLYTVGATGNPSGCANTMSGSTSVSILTSPAIISMTGGGAVCGGGPGVPVGLAASAIGISYQLFLGGVPSGSPVNGVGSAFNFGIYTTLGTYTATATNTVNGCVSNMSGTAVINAASGITAFAMTGGGSYCSGGAGVSIGLANSTSGISYQLFLGASAVGSPVVGTGSAISFGPQTSAGTYTVVGTNTTTGCFGNMTGSVAVTINPLPNIHTVTGGGVYCAGGTGVPIGLSLSQSGVDYQLYNGASPAGSPVAGTGGAISFGSITAAGTYSVTAINTTTTCTNGMGGTVTVSINPLPAVTTGGGSIVCAGSPTGLTASGATTYSWSPATALSATTGSSVTASPTTTITYTVSGTDVNGCVNTASATVTVNPLPAVSAASNVAICTGSSTALTASGAVTYTWDPASTLSASTGAGVTANPTSTTTYTVTGTDVNSCVNTATVTVSVNPLPTVSGGSDVGICIGASTVLTATGAATYSWAPPTALSATTGASVTANPVTTTTYTVTGTDANGCVNAAIVTVSVNALPSVSAGSNVAICSGLSTGLTATGATTYSWTPAAGLSATTGASVTASPTVTTTYTVTGSTSGCNNTASVTVTVNALPVVTAGTSAVICAGIPTGLSASGASTYVWSPSFSLSATTGASVTASPTVTITYTVTGTDANGCINTAGVTLTVNPLPVITTGGAAVICESTPTSLTASGAATYVWSPAVSLSASTGTAVIATPAITTTYTITGTSALGCVNTGFITLTVNPLPTNYAITGGGSFCSGTSGVAIGLAGSDAGINYQLYRAGSIAVGSPVAGTGAAISFGIQTITGTYTVVATNAATGCIRNISGSTAITAFTSPAIVSVTGGGSYCVGGTGVNIGLAASATGVNYQLWLGASAIGSPVAGVGSGLSFGLLTTAGTYTVTATNVVSGCTTNMSGSATVAVYPALTTYSVTGGGSYCSGGSGVAVGLSGSTIGVNYQLYRGGLPIVSTIISGTGGALSWGAQTTAGVYTVVATNAVSGCTANMTSSATVTVNSLPTIYTVTGGGSYCSGGTGVLVGLSNSDLGIDYQLYNGVTAVGSPVAGTGAAISYGLQTTVGTYTIVATNATTGCVATMSGSTAVAVNSLPTVYTVSGGGSYCSGAGYHILLSGSNFGVNYQLYLGASTVGSPIPGTGSGLDFGAQTAAGTYTVIATNATSLCTSNMSGSGVIIGVSLPAIYAMTGGGSLCSGATGVAVGLASSDLGINYQLYRGATAVGSAMAGTGAALNFGVQTTAGTYTVVATNATLGCTSTMSGSAVVVVNPLPVPLTVTGGGSYCSGGTGVVVGLIGSVVGTNYQLFLGATPIGSPVAGTGTALNYGLQTTAGTYTVTATNTVTGCANSMSGSATVSINSLPTTFSVTGGGSYCAGGTGVTVGLGGSQIGVNYQLFLGASPVGSPLSGTGSAISFGLKTAAGAYTVVATNASTACTSNMTGSATVAINALPTVYSVTGGGAYCSGGTGVSIGLANSDAGVNYQLYDGAFTVGSPVAGTGAAISFGSTFTSAATYTVRAASATTGCTNNMSGSATVTINSLPASVPVTGGGTICIGGSGVAIGLAASATGVNYQLYLGASTVGSPVAGAGTSISFGLLTTVGTYTVTGTNATTGCSNAMTGSAVISNYAPLTAYTVTGTGSYCTGGTGLAVGLSGSSTGVTYQLYRGATAVGSSISGTGAALNFGLQTIAGTYTVVGTNTATTCTGNMTGSAVISINPLPTAYTVNGGGGYCTGGTGVSVGLASSQVGVNYQLYNGASAVGSPVAGTGTAISFGLQTAAGSYTVVATNSTTGCVNNMSGSVTVSINPLPTVYTVSGGGSYCSGPGIHIFLSNSTSGVNYQLFNGATPVGGPVAGTGVSLDFGGFTVVGTYTVVATNATTGCANNMTGSGIITGASLPVVYSVTGGGNYCSGGSGVAIGVSNSDVGVSYQLFLGATPVGSPVAGTGAAISFGLKTAAGTYTVVGTNVGLSCTSTMSGSATITITPPPTAYSVTGGGSYCSGGTGVLVGLANSQSGVNYQLYIGAAPVGSPVAGTGAAISFGLKTTAGAYTVIASDASTGCTANMTGSTTISVNALPTVFTVTGGGTTCASTSGVLVGLASSQVGVSYQLFNGASTSGSPVAGTGAAISFGFKTVSGTYTVVATNTTTSCTNNMSGSAVVNINPLPTDWAFTGGGTFCLGGSVTIGLVNSDAGVNYQLYRTTTSLGTVTVGSAVAGTGSAISFGSQTLAGVYTVIATNATTGCVRTLSGSTTIAVFFPPAILPVTGGGSYCTGGTGVAVTLGGSAVGTNYQLFLGATPVGSPVAGAGTGISFGLQTTAGTYTVIATNATTGCTSNMSGSATVSINPLPSVFTVTGGGSYCSGGPGLHIFLSSSTTGVTYKLYNGATPVTGSIAGTGTTIDFGLFTATGTYTAKATNTTTGCLNNMTGSATISILPLPVAGTISGPSTVHNLATITLTSSSPGGVWTSSNPGVATVGSSTGIVTGVAIGYTNIFYTVSTSCGTVYTVKNICNLGPEPMTAGDVILGNTIICQNERTTLSCSHAGGTWSSSNRNIASIDETTGEVTGNGAGVVAITYTITDGAMTNSVYTPLMVNAVPDAAIVTAQPGSSIAAGQMVTLSAKIANGSLVQSYQWSINGEAVANANTATYNSNNFADNDVVSCSIKGACGNEPVVASVKISVSSEDVAQVVAAATSITVLPNPNKGTFTIKGNFSGTTNDEATVEMINVLGQVVYKESVQIRNGAINHLVKTAGELANGMYLLTLRSNLGDRVFHVVIEK